MKNIFFFFLFLVLSPPLWAEDRVLDIIGNDTAKAKQLQWAELNQQFVESYDLGKLQEAKLAIDQAVGLAREIFGEKHLNYAATISNQAIVAKATGELDTAISLFTKVLAIRESSLGSQNESVALMYFHLGDSWLLKGDFNKSLKYLQRALDIRKNILHSEHPELAQVYNSLGEAYLSLKKFKEAKTNLSAAIAIDEKTLGPDHIYVARDLNNLAGMYMLQKDYAQAKPLFERVLGILEKAFGPNDPHVATVLANLVLLHEKTGNKEQAKELQSRISLIRSQPVE